MATARSSAVNRPSPDPARASSPDVSAPERDDLTLPGTIALLLLVIGGINWGLVGLAGVDVVAWIFGPMSVAARVVYVVVGLAALYCLVKLPRWSRAG